MTLLDTLKSLLGLESTDRRPEPDEDVSVTVEREAGEEADAATERSVKGVGDRTADETGTTEPEAAGEPTTTGEAGAEPETAEPEPTETTEPEPAGADEAAGEAAEDAEAERAAGTDESPDVLEGIGPAYADRLAGAGVETVADLQAADAGSLAEDADISESRLERWIERARNR
jgi:predicted flap endonuclease-1-like 5' DNA nuclease